MAKFKYFKYLNDAQWERLPLADFRPRFFIECYVEKLRMQTPHFYQSRLLNVFSACSEMLEHIDAHKVNEKNGAYITASMEELIENWDTDPIAQEIFSDIVSLKEELARRVKSPDLDSNTQSRLKGISRAILRRKDQYITTLIERLEDAILEETNLTQRDRITSLIDRLTGLYTTYLLNQGYSPTYLFNRSAMFVRGNNYGGRSFSEQFQIVTSRLRSQQSTFEVYFGFHASKPRVLISVNDESDLQFLDGIPAEITGINQEKLKKNIKINVVAKIVLDSTDHVTAALRAKERIDRFLDTTALEFGSESQVSANCVIISRSPLLHAKTLNVEVLLEFISSESGTVFSQSAPPIRQIFKNLNEAAKDQLGRSLRHLRLAKHSVSLEQKLLNLWIALESLFANSHPSIISNILEFVPKFYAVVGLTRRVAYLRELLVENQISITPIIATEICPGATIFNSSVSEKDVFMILRNEKAAIELFNSLSNKEHLKFKLMQIFGDLRNNKAISARLARSEADVSRQLRRIYFLRNKIAHTGHFLGLRPQLVTHLLDYVAISYRIIAAAACKAETDHTYSIVELLTAARMGADLVATRAASKDEIATLDHITPHAVI